MQLIYNNFIEILDTSTLNFFRISNDWIDLSKFKYDPLSNYLEDTKFLIWFWSYDLIFHRDIAVKAQSLKRDKRRNSDSQLTNILLYIMFEATIQFWLTYSERNA